MDCLLRQDFRCPRCREPLAKPIQFDHAHCLGLGGTNDSDNWCALHEDCHAIKTHGTKATTAGSDIHAMAKVRRLAKDTGEFYARMSGTRPAAEPKRNWPKRPLRGRNDLRKEKRT